jgi:hypothetical protein
MRSINLIPAQRRVQRRARRRLRFWPLVLAGAAGLMAIACGVLRARVPAVVVTDAELAKVSTRLGELNTSLAGATKVAADREFNRSTLALLKDQPDWSLLLELLAAQTQEQTVLREIRLTPIAQAAVAPTVKEAGKTPPPRQIELPAKFKLELRGLCKSPAGVSQFVANIEKLGIFSDVKLLRTGREPFLTGVASNFEMECTLGETRGAK